MTWHFAEYESATSLTAGTYAEIKRQRSVLRDPERVREQAARRALLLGAGAGHDLWRHSQEHTDVPRHAVAAVQGGR